jgi:hypothetical protein
MGLILWEKFPTLGGAAIVKKYYGVAGNKQVLQMPDSLYEAVEGTRWETVAAGEVANAIETSKGKVMAVDEKKIHHDNP